jgi:ATP-dependent DNA helicase RecQ
MITTMKKSGKSAQEISTIVFEAVVTDQVKLTKSLGKCLIINNNVDELDDQDWQELEQDCAEKRSYKHGLLDYFVHLIENCENSRQIHQEIGRHLGVPKFLLNRIYKTTKGDLVRSKSEVIIANLLNQHGVSYEYEKELAYGPGRRLSPDFTITVNGKELYWEHLGLIGNMEYDSHWVKKQAVYEEYFPGQLLVSYENPHLSTSAESIIQKILLSEEL